MTTPFSLGAESVGAEAKRALSGATLWWAISSGVVVMLASVGADVTYEQALPVVVLVSWLAAEANARWAKRTPIAICDGCNTVITFPHGLLRRSRTWKHCSSCGRSLHHTCDRGHHLGVIDGEAPSQPFYCSRCGVGVPPQILTASEFDHQMDSILRRMPKEQKPEFYWMAAQSVVDSIPADTAMSVGYWQALTAMAERMVPTPYDDSEAMILALLGKLQEAPGKWDELQTEILRIKPPRVPPAKILAHVAKLLESKTTTTPVIAKLAAEVAIAIQENEKAKHDIWDTAF